MGRLDRAWSFEENCRDDQAFHESEVIRGKSLCRYPVEVQCRTLYREHGALAKKGLNAHRRTNLVYSINHLAQDKSIVDRAPGSLHDRPEVPFL